jgi:hypothetical protein
MSSQVISYRLSTKEVLELRQKALPGESDSQTAQRLMRVVIGLSTGASTLSTLTLDERIENVVQEKLSTFAVNQNELINRLQERLQHTESRLEEMLTRVEARVSPLSVNSVDNIVDKKSDRFLSGADLAKRLGVNPTTLSKNRNKPNFAQWSQEKDPEQLPWQYMPKVKQYALLSSKN